MAITLVGGLTELVGGFRGAWNDYGGDMMYTDENHALVSATASWQIPFVSTLFGSSILASCFDVWRNLGREERYELGRCESRFLGSIVCVSAIGALLANLANGQSTGDFACFIIGGSLGTLYSPIFLTVLKKIRRRLQFLELRQHLREELFVPK